MGLGNYIKKGWDYSPMGASVNFVKNGIEGTVNQYKGGSDEDPNNQFKSSMGQGMAEGRALGESIMADPDLVKSRADLKGNLALTGPNKDLINQQASKQVANMRYKGSKMSPQQELEAQRKLTSDIGAQSFVEDRQKSKDLYDIDLGKAKFLGGMSMAGAQMAVSQQEQKKSMLGGMMDSIGLSNIF